MTAVQIVTPREGRVSRNAAVMLANLLAKVTPREGRVSRNHGIVIAGRSMVTPREGRVSRNVKEEALTLDNDSHAPRGACE